ncbi:hypothetical protein D3C78_1424930 [compost metagenome]
MTQNIKLQQVSIKSVIIKVCGLPFGIDIIRRELYWRNIFYLHIVWNNDYTTRMLSRTTFNACTAGRQTANFSSTPTFLVKFFVFFCKSEGCLLSYRTNRSGTEYIFLTKHFFGKIVR